MILSCFTIKLPTNCSPLHPCAGNAYSECITVIKQPNSDGHRMCHMRWMIPHSRDENTSWSLPGALLLRPLTSMKPRVMVAYQICLVQNNHVISWDPLFHAKDTRDWTPSSSYEGHMQMTNFRVPAGSFPPPHPCDEDVDTRPLASGSVSSLPVAVDHIVMCPRQPVMGTSQHNQKAAPTVCQCRCSQPNGIFFIG
ncbi:hypothetical protein BHE74_00005136 [Ensete ventricosum]|nr:hypothetical protein BHE74_00005136 [Ensete ventricosum]